MKLIQVAAFVFLLLVSTIPEETEAAGGNIPLSWFKRIATKLAVKLIVNSFYARCNCRNVPAGINCPGVVFGVGRTRNEAQNAARAYANTFGDNRCGTYVGHCQIYQFKGRGK